MISSAICRTFLGWIGDTYSMLNDTSDALEHKRKEASRGPNWWEISDAFGMEMRGGDTVSNEEHISGLHKKMMGRLYHKCEKRKMPDW